MDSPSDECILEDIASFADDIRAEWHEEYLIHATLIAFSCSLEVRERYGINNEEASDRGMNQGQAIMEYAFIR